MEMFHPDQWVQYEIANRRLSKTVLEIIYR